ncbi:MAG: hypothetical protein H7336_16410 [Bacteriovorax sp.]|nr:hypothetical protein [Bacteriovorax sp.]
MVRYFISSLIILTFNSYAGELKCSANGAWILHIPGAFTSGSDQNEVNKLLKTKILVTNPNNFDLKKQNADVIPIASQGFIQDKFNYYLMSITQNYGAKAENAVWMTLGISEFGYNISEAASTIFKAGKTLTKMTAIKELGVTSSKKFLSGSELKKEIVAAINLQSAQKSAQSASTQSLNTFLHDISNEDNMDPLTRIGKGISIGTSFFDDPMGVKNLINFFSIVALEGKFNIDVLDAQRDTILATYFTNQKNINHVADEIKKKLDLNKKIILSAHGEGNQLVSRAIAQIQNSGTNDQKDKLSRVVSVLATSPTTDSYASKYLFMKHNYDNRSYGGSSIAANYILNKNTIGPITWSTDLSDLNNPQDSGNQGNSFLKYYLSEVTKGGKNITGATESTMRDNFINELRASAESLEGNCIPDIVIDVPGAIQNKMIPTRYDYQNFTNHENKLKISIADKNDIDNSTIFTLRYINSFDSFWFKLGDLVSIDSKEITDFVFPFSNTPFELEVNATNQDGKTSQKIFSIITSFDRAPDVSAVVSKCAVYGNGQPTGSYEYYGFDVTDLDSAMYPPAVKGFIAASENEIYRIDTYYSGPGDVTLKFKSSDTVSTSYYISPCN